MTDTVPAAGERDSDAGKSTLRHFMIPPAQGWHRKSMAIVSSGIFWPLIGLIGVLILLGISSFIMLSQPQYINDIYLAQISLLFMGVVLIGLILYRVNHHLMQPLAHLRNWAVRMRGGNLAARIPLPDKGEFRELAVDINSLGDELMKLTREMDEQVSNQIQRIAQKNRSLEILYDVAASINISRNIDDLLIRFLRILNDVVHAKASTLRLLQEDKSMRLTASLGMDINFQENEKVVSIEQCICGKRIANGELMSEDNIELCVSRPEHLPFRKDNVEMIAVPLQYRGNILGVYNLFVEKSGLLQREDIKDLLISIGRHMGMAIEKTRLDEESKRISIFQERNLLSGELHDSLAQTLASLRFQVRTLSDSIVHADIDSATRELLQIRNGLDEAYTELRELIAHFRAPFDERGLITSILKTIDRFRKETGILIFFQNEWKEENLPSTMEIQVLRIVQESLTNIRKHSHAHAVRVLLRSEPEHMNMLLIEDDGVGIGKPVLDGAPGEHVGLSIMQERAQRLGGELVVESEIGEGTRIILSFRTPDAIQRNLLEMLE